jgi:hypothetical protein
MADVIELLVNNRSPLASGALAVRQRLRTIYSEVADVFLNDWPRWWNPVAPRVVSRRRPCAGAR